jgi:hypothetical protein
MSDWLHDLPVLWMALLVFGGTYLITGAINAVVTLLAVGERLRSFSCDETHVPTATGTTSAWASVPALYAASMNALSHIPKPERQLPQLFKLLDIQGLDELGQAIRKGLGCLVRYISASALTHQEQRGSDQPRHRHRAEYLVLEIVTLHHRRSPDYLSIRPLVAAAHMQTLLSHANILRVRANHGGVTNPTRRSYRVRCS